MLYWIVINDCIDWVVVVCGLVAMIKLCLNNPKSPSYAPASSSSPRVRIWANFLISMLPLPSVGASDKILSASETLNFSPQVTNEWRKL